MPNSNYIQKTPHKLKLAAEHLDLLIKPESSELLHLKHCI